MSGTEGATLLALDHIELGAKVRELAPDHVPALAKPIALRGLVVALVVQARRRRPTLRGGRRLYTARRAARA